MEGREDWLSGLCRLVGCTYVRIIIYVHVRVRTFQNRIIGYV